MLALLRRLEHGAVLGKELFAVDVLVKLKSCHMPILPKNNLTGCKIGYKGDRS
jgi:hypothetical protein